MNRQKVGLYLAWLVTVPMLVFTVLEKHPYGFYTFVRWLSCTVFAYSAAAAVQAERNTWVWVFGTSTVLFNPIIPFHFQRATWQVIDWMAIGVIVVASVAFWPSGEGPKSSNRA